MVYYGLSMNPNFLGGNLYVNFVFGALMEIPAVTIVYLLINRVGRKPLLAGGFIISSLCALSSLLIENSDGINLNSNNKLLFREQFFNNFNHCSVFNSKMCHNNYICNHLYVFTRTISHLYT